ncbi:biotin synthase [Vibrio sp. 10N.286.49.C2]|uniref:type II secretion system F family protein n=1 Tax=unclassified Vibrio TaxID=2614977 RepID=UPI000C85C367|nr:MULTISPECIES: type II secretion system F family protein [unclassified Vibrio]PMH31603.1 biotin synthase [Vibrio sp. 10N.286.49.C2]PMH50625.1 biotin synthase [Vibrio sp. 10N.286.49.B1]PMH82805.1 biotin synthase [Vibrio sp. 10N.286.48.B7]
MTLVIAFLVVLAALLYFVLNSLRYEQRRKRIAGFIEEESNRGPTTINRLLVRFGKGSQKELEQKLVNAGYYNKEWAKYYFPAKVVFLLLVLVGVFFSELSDTNKMLVGLFTLIGVIVVPDLLLEVRRKALVGKTSSQLPYLLDMMSVCVQTGMTIEATLSYLSKELEAFDGDLCYQIKRTSDSAKIKGLEKALDDLSERIPTPAVRSFVLTLIQNLQYGTSVAHVLSDLAEDMRKIQVLTVEEKVGSLSAKMSVPLILFIMFPIVILILAPGIMQMSINIGG